MPTIIVPLGGYRGVGFVVLKNSAKIEKSTKQCHPSYGNSISRKTGTLNRGVGETLYLRVTSATYTLHVKVLKFQYLTLRS